MTNDKGKQILHLAVSIMMHSHSWRMMWPTHQKRRSPHGQTWHQTAPQGLAHRKPLRCVSSRGGEGIDSRGTSTSCVTPCMLWHRHCITCRQGCVGLVSQGCVKTCGTLTVIFCEHISPMLPSAVSPQPVPWVIFIWQADYSDRLQYLSWLISLIVMYLMLGPIVCNILM
jgi:hypothetical protein